MHGSPILKLHLSVICRVNSTHFSIEQEHIQNGDGSHIEAMKAQKALSGVRLFFFTVLT